MFYTTEDKVITKLQLQLKAEELNNLQEIQLVEFLKDFCTQYGTKQFNKRFSTALDKALADKYGTHPIERYDGVTEWGNVYSGMHKLDYTGSDSYSVKVYFKGKECWYDYDTKTYKLGENTKNLDFYSVTDALALVEHCDRILVARVESNVKIQANQKSLKRLIAKRNKLVTEVNQFNDLVSYAVADELRIK